MLLTDAEGTARSAKRRQFPDAAEGKPLEQVAELQMLAEHVEAIVLPSCLRPARCASHCLPPSSGAARPHDLADR